MPSTSRAIAIQTRPTGFSDVPPSGPEIPDVATAKRTYAEKLQRPLDYLENEVGGAGFLVGDALSIADISLACQLVQLELVAGPLDATRWPGVAGLVGRLAQRPSFTPCR